MSRSDNQVCEEFFQKFNAHIVKGGLRPLTPVVHEMFKFLKFHSKQDRKELQFHMEPVITKMMGTLLEQAHPMVMACAYSVTPGCHSAGASQGRLNALSQTSSQGDTASITKNDLSAIVIPASSYLLELDQMRTKTAAQLTQLIKAEQEVMCHCSVNMQQRKVIVLQVLML